MCEAFTLGQDIHARTAAEVYGVPLDEVTPQMRSSAKAVNFGIVYGISDFGLAANLGIFPRKEAAGFHRALLSRAIRAIHRFMDACVSQGKAEGYVRHDVRATPPAAGTEQPELQPPPIRRARRDEHARFRARRQISSRSR